MSSDPSGRTFSFIARPTLFPKIFKPFPPFKTALFPLFSLLLFFRFTIPIHVCIYICVCIHVLSGGEARGRRDASALRRTKRRRAKNSRKNRSHGREGNGTGAVRGGRRSTPLSLPPPPRWGWVARDSVLWTFFLSQSRIPFAPLLYSSISNESEYDMKR